MSLARHLLAGEFDPRRPDLRTGWGRIDGGGGPCNSGPPEGGATSSKPGSKLSAVLLGAMVGYVTVPGCTITIRPGHGDPAEEGSTAGEDREEPGGETTPEAPGEPEGPAGPDEPSFEDMDPQELALASARAGFTA
ncbi:hypothetical protein WMF30_07365 [Sorangium sp. So ce134]